MAVASKANVAGANVLQIATRTSAGYATGQAGTAPANGTTSHAYMTQDISTSGFSPRAPVVVEFEAGNAIVGKTSYGGSDLQAFDITGDAEDHSIMALTNGSNKDTTTVSGWEVVGSNPLRIAMPDMIVMITNEFISREAATKGTTFYRNVIIPSCKIRCNIGGFAFQGKVPFTMNVTPTSAAKFPNGVAFSSNQAWADNTIDHYVIVTENPLALTTFISDGTETDFITGYRPVSTVVTISTRPNWFARNGTAQALSSIVTTTGVATMAAAGTAGDFNVLVYETNFVTI